jgi:hypothetical protein
MITADVVLTHYDLPVQLACDASPYGLRSVLSHATERPVVFASLSLTKSERSSSIDLNVQPKYGNTGNYSS